MQNNIYLITSLLIHELVRIKNVINFLVIDIKIR